MVVQKDFFSGSLGGGGVFIAFNKGLFQHFKAF
jgi:hypothetical protein